MLSAEYFKKERKCSIPFCAPIPISPAFSASRLSGVCRNLHRIYTFACIHPVLSIHLHSLETRTDAHSLPGGQWAGSGS